jgi:hypothetical protein
MGSSTKQDQKENQEQDGRTSSRGMEAPFEGGKGPVGAAAPYTDGKRWEY